MKKTILFTLIYLSNLNSAEEPMRPFEILKEFENCYDAMIPATEKTQETFAWFSDIPDPFFNAIMHLSGDRIEAKVDALIKIVPAGNPVSFWVHSENSEELAPTIKNRGFSSAMTCALMASAVQLQPLPAAIIRPAKEHWEEFLQITKVAFHFEPLTLEKYANVLAQIHSENYLIYLNSKPVGTGILFPNGDTGGIFNIAVLPEYQHRGCGKAMMQFLINRAEELGLKRLVLLSSPIGVKFYTELGFEKTLDIDIYVR